MVIRRSLQLSKDLKMKPLPMQQEREFIGEGKAEAATQRREYRRVSQNIKEAILTGNEQRKPEDRGYSEMSRMMQAAAENFNSCVSVQSEGQN